MTIKDTKQIHELEKRLKALEAESKLLSKEIGQAKKNKDPNADAIIAKKKKMHLDEIDPLKATIKQLKSSERCSKSISQENGLTMAVEVPSPYIEKQRSSENDSSLTLKQVEISKEPNTDKWDAFIDNHPMGSIYYQSDFLRSIYKSLGHRILLLSLVDQDTGQVKAALPIIEQKSILFGHLWTSIALVNYGGVLAVSEIAEKKLLEQAETSAKREGVERLEVRGLYKRPISWRASTEKASMWLKLPSNHNPDELLKHFKAKLRSQIKKGYTDEVSCRVGGVELVDDYYKVFARNMRDLGTPVYSKTLFRGLLKDLTENAKLVVIYFSGKPASAALLIKNNRMMEIPWASTIREYNSANLNMVLYWEVLKYSCERQCDVFDFGRSSVGASTYRFKKQWGAQPVQHYWYSWEPYTAMQQTQHDSNAQRQTSAENPKFRILIAFWKHLPVWISKLIGPGIVKYIP